MREDAVYWVWLASVFGSGSRYYKHILSTGKTAKDIFHYDFSGEELSQFPKVIAAALDCKDLTLAESVIRTCEKKGMKIITLGDAEYPMMLREIDNPPGVLFYNGTLVNDEILISIVGTRSSDDSGRKTAVQFANDLMKSGFGLVSGFAKGIDICIHKAALKKGAYTIAVLASGLDVDYPFGHKRYKEEIERTGLVMTEFFPGTKAYPGNFRIRNRIISALSVGTLVIEAPKDSGALITANHALDQGRDLFVVPGAITDIRYEGSNELIKKGAKLVSEYSDILIDYITIYPEKLTGRTVEPDKPDEEITDVDFDTSIFLDLEEDEIRILMHMIASPKDLDELIRKTELSVNIITANLTILELKGYIIRQDAKKYKFNKEKLGR